VGEKIKASRADSGGNALLAGENLFEQAAALLIAALEAYEAPLVVEGFDKRRLGVLVLRAPGVVRNVSREMGKRGFVVSRVVLETVHLHFMTYLRAVQFSRFLDWNCLCEGTR
jgi:hypothetical protein